MAEAGGVGSGEGRNRTGDTTVFSRVLYRLSYLAERRQSSRAAEHTSLIELLGQRGDQTLEAEIDQLVGGRQGQARPAHP